VRLGATAHRPENCRKTAQSVVLVGLLLHRRKRCGELAKVEPSHANRAVDSIVFRMQLHEPQLILQAQLKPVGGAQRHAERVEHIWVERISSKRLLVQFYGPVDLPEDECAVPEGAWQQFRSGVYLADALVTCLRGVPIPGDVHLECGSRVVRVDEVWVEPDGAVQRIENSRVLLLRWRSPPGLLDEVRVRQACPPQRVLRIAVDCPFVELSSPLDIAQRTACLEVPSLQKEIVRLNIGLSIYGPVAVPQGHSQGLGNLP